MSIELINEYRVIKTILQHLNESQVESRGINLKQPIIIIQSNLPIQSTIKQSPVLKGQYYIILTKVVE